MNGNIELLRNYILVTPCKNEQNNLPHLIQSIVSQDIKPVIWVIIDDGSDDNTPQIIKKATDQYDWIKTLELDKIEKRDLGLHLAEITQKGFEFAIDYCNDNTINYNYLGNIDGDLTLEHTFYRDIILEFEKDQKLGIASGGIRLTIGDKLVYVRGLPEDEPSGGDMLVRRKCFEDCNGVPQSYSYDTVLKAKARINQWKTKRFERVIATESRDVGNAEGYLKGFFQMGKSSYFINLHPIHVFAKGILNSLRRPFYGGIAYIAGYLYSFLKRNKQIEDNNIKKYFWNKWKKVYRKRLSKRVIHEVVK